MSRPAESATGPELLRALGLFDTIMLVVGTVIGSGVFLVPAEIARAVHGAAPMPAVWIIGGFFTLLGAMSLAELGAAMPRAGGLYTFISRAWGETAGFLCGWMLFTVATSGSIATLAAALPIYVGGFIPLSPAAAKAIGLAAIGLFTAINLFGVERGALAQNVLTVLKVGGILAMVGAIFLLPPTPRSAPDAPGAISGSFGVAAFGTALVAVLWAYEGWHDVSFMRWPSAASSLCAARSRSCRGRSACPVILLSRCSSSRARRFSSPTHSRRRRASRSWASPSSLSGCRSIGSGVGRGFADRASGGASLARRRGKDVYL